MLWVLLGLVAVLVVLAIAFAPAMLRDHRASRLMARGQVSLQSNNVADALACFDEVLALTPGNKTRQDQVLALLTDGERTARESGHTEQALLLARGLCNLGASAACTELGLQLIAGVALPANHEQAARHFRKACDGGAMPACFHLGVMHADGTGIARDDAEALRLYRRACDGKEAGACTALGGMYEAGRGIARDGAEARKLYKKACDARHQTGCARLEALEFQARQLDLAAAVSAPPSTDQKAPIARAASSHEVWGTQGAPDEPWLNLRAAANPDAAILANLPDGTGLRVKSKAGKWLQVEVASGKDAGKSGFVRDRFVRAVRANP